MAKNLTVDQEVEKQIRNSTAALQDMVDGIARTNKKPMQLAKAQIPKMRANFNKAIDDGTVAAGFDSVSDSEWKERSIDGANRNYVGGIEASRPRRREFVIARQEFIKQTQAAIDALPTTTKAERKAKMNANFDRMEQFKFRRRLRK